MNTSPINIEIDWDNVVTHYSFDTTRSEQIMDEYGPPLDLYSCLRESIEAKLDPQERYYVISNSEGTYCEDISELLSLDTVKMFLKNTNNMENTENTENTEKFDIEKATKILRTTWKHANLFNDFVLIADPDLKHWNTKGKKREWIRKMLQSPEKFRIDVNGNDFKLCDILINEKMYSEFLHWWSLFI